MIELGTEARDKVSGLRGLVTARAEYLFAGPQVLLVPRETNNGAPLGGTWLDESRVEPALPQAPVGIR